MTDESPSFRKQFKELEETYKDRLPKNWDELSNDAKLDWFGHRMLLDDRENADDEVESFFLSDYQLERRRRREVQSKLNGWDDIPPRQGMFRRVHVDKNNMIVGKKEDDGPKNP